MIQVPKRYKLLLIPTLVITVTFILLLSQYRYQIQNALSYATRPLWDKAEGPKAIIPHYYTEGMEMDSYMCKMHGWGPRTRAASDVKVLDAVLMSSELDLLEIRMHELDPVVDYFLIVESNATFTGLPKQTYFADNRARFSKFNSKIVYLFLPGYPLTPSQSAWDVEAHTRGTMSSLLKQQISQFPAQTETLVIMSDVDEIPSRHSISLLKACEFGRAIHLQLRNYLYSFEWYIGPSSWRASMHRWVPGITYYRHSQSTEAILADAGWHCSYCFRTIKEYVVKMTGFSHSDRVGGDMRLLEPQRIQDTICQGKDIFGMLPEAYSYADLLSQLSLTPQTSAVGLPLYLIKNADRFRFLLPGGCKREA
ncbi:hypothetical protein PC9H_007383 [Pleurotus ostreatus]|uniref:Glycosyltransferase family 17 protein n=1 Tax=Pleurotus ostreatus TaxID=5322 RepID=A0A8H7DRH3_PLEOS|nr:uncharacterized protein PC9H_007383 [Pleurotus ostreatus]KAF7428162.1 hypothetical protein PC9H_007383 [Pleurotus ostreatus]KAJ8696231.1 hypothetical protein PTI98_006118 [Pleurotus ostreatus]